MMVRIDGDAGHKPAKKGTQWVQCSKCMDLKRRKKKWRRSCPGKIVIVGRPV